MMDKIRFQYDDLQDISRRFRELADRAEYLLRRSNYCLQRLDDGVWIGRGADEYREEMETLILPALRRLTALMSDTAWVLNRSADTMREAEEQGARLFRGEGRPLNVHFDSLGIGGGSIGNGTGGSGWSSAELERLAEYFRGLNRGRGDDFSNINNISDESLELRFGRGWVDRVRGMLDSLGGFFPSAGGGDDSTNPFGMWDFAGGSTPPWYTENSTEDGGMNGASNAPVMVAGAGDHGRLTEDIARASRSVGGGPVSGVYAVEEDVVRGPGGIIVPNPAVNATHPAVTAMVAWLREHPDGLFIMPPFTAQYGAEALHLLAAEGFDLSGLNVVTLGENVPDLPEGLNHRSVTSLADLVAPA